jgi:hypothetical protein
MSRYQRAPSPRMAVESVEAEPFAALSEPPSDDSAAEPAGHLPGGAPRTELSSAGPRFNPRQGVTQTLLRYIVWGLAFAVLFTGWMAVRVQVSQLRQDLVKLSEMRAQQLAAQEQLRLKRATRSGALALEATAEAGGLVSVERRYAPPAPGPAEVAHE